MGAECQGKVQQIRWHQICLCGLLVSLRLVQKESNWILTNFPLAGERGLFVNNSLQLESVPLERLPTLLS
jgi:hypothetical protein